MAKAVVDFGIAGLVIGDITWVACKRSRDNADVSTTGSTLTAFGTLGAYWLENPNVTEPTNFQVYAQGNTLARVTGEFTAAVWSAPSSPSASALSICNNAILQLGGNTITSFDDSTRAEAILCKNLWAQALDTVLRLHPWNCAIKRVLLHTPDVTAPVYEFTAAFSLPSDLVRLLDIDGLAEGYRVENGKILCDETELYIRYVYRNESPETWDRLFVEVMTQYMAYLLAYPITKSGSVRSEQLKMFAEILRTAKAVDAQEEPGQTVGDFPFIDVRSY